jgi:hypothetical protein
VIILYFHQLVDELQSNAFILIEKSPKDKVAVNIATVYFPIGRVSDQIVFKLFIILTCTTRIISGCLPSAAERTAMLPAGLSTFIRLYLEMYLIGK